MYYYYSTDGTKFTSKIKALEYATLHNQVINFYYYDDIYSKLNWKEEPCNTLDYYYLEQAQRIRDEYDYVILAFSGGYDSSNILETFYFNNIKIDKIITVGALSQDSTTGVDENHNGELYHNVFPYIKELGLESILEVYDYTKYFSNLNNFSISSYGNDWVDNIGCWYSPHNWFWRDIEKFVVPKAWQNKKVAIVFGKDKPCLFYGPTGSPSTILPSGRAMLNGYQFRDTPVMSYGNSTGLDSCDRINFYWDPKSPNILLKQLHVLNKVYQTEYTSNYLPEVGVQVLSGTSIDSIIYNLRRPILFKSPKSKDNILSLRDKYLTSKKNSDIFDVYSAGLDNIQTRIGLSKLIAIPSRFYHIR